MLPAQRTSPLSLRTYWQLIRYGMIGLATNLVGYGLYLAATTSYGVGHKTTATAVYLAGTFISFYLNGRWAFKFSGAFRPAFYRYLSTYALGYAFNWLGLHLGVDQFGIPHEIVQAVLTLIIAALLFILQKYWVFPLIFRDNMSPLTTVKPNPPLG